MLKKLLKYDLKWLMKIITIFLSIGLGLSVIGRLMDFLPDSVFFIVITKICKGAALSLIITGLANCIIRSWVRFIMNLYHDEAYLTHTLPVEKKTIFLSKALSSFIVVLISIVTLFIGLVIMYYNKNTMSILKEYLNALSSTLDISVVMFIVTVLLVIFLEIFFLIMVGYLGILYGYSYNQNKLFSSLVISVGIYMIGSIASIGMMLIAGLFNEGFKNILFGGSGEIQFDLLKVLMLLAIIIYSVYIVILYYLSVRKFNKGVNVD